jgi:hypothetical protein
MTTSTEGARVTALLLLFEKAVRAVKLYPPTNPACREFLERLHAEFAVLLEEIDPLVLRITRSELLFAEEVVYASADTRESLAFVLHKDGLREIGFNRGLGFPELKDLVQGFNRDFSLEYLDDDLATYLWERELPHVFFHVSEDYLSEGLPAGLALEEDQDAAVRRTLHVDAFEPGQLLERVRGLAPAGAGAVVALHRPRLRPEHLVLTREEIGHLQELQARDESHVFSEEMLEAVFSILARETTAERLRPYLALFASLFESYLAAGSLSPATALLRRLHRIAAEPTPLGHHVDELLAGLGSPGQIARLAESMDRGAIPDPETLPDLLALFPAAAVPGLVGLLGTLASLRWRKLVCRGLAGLGAEGITLFADGLGDPRWYVVRNLAYTLGLIDDRRSIPHLVRLLDHGDFRVRREALRALGRNSDPEARRHILAALRHPDQATRMQALRGLPGGADPLAAGELARIVREPAFAARPFGERLEFSRALGRVSGDEVVPGLEARLRRRGWLRRRSRRREDQLVTALALITLNTPAARAALSRAAALVEPEAQRVIASFLAGEAPDPAGLPTP